MFFFTGVVNRQSSRTLGVLRRPCLSRRVEILMSGEGTPVSLENPSPPKALRSMTSHSSHLSPQKFVKVNMCQFTYLLISVHR